MFKWWNGTFWNFWMVFFSQEECFIGDKSLWTMHYLCMCQNISWGQFNTWKWTHIRFQKSSHISIFLLQIGVLFSVFLSAITEHKRPEIYNFSISIHWNKSKDEWNQFFSFIYFQVRNMFYCATCLNLEYDILKIPESLPFLAKAFSYIS